MVMAWIKQWTELISCRWLEVEGDEIGGDGKAVMWVLTLASLVIRVSSSFFGPEVWL